MAPGATVAAPSGAAAGPQSVPYGTSPSGAPNTLSRSPGTNGGPSPPRPVQPQIVQQLAAREPEETTISPRTGKPKRRKAVRACVHCQRTHLTCDNNRPCERCVLRGLADTCEDGARKKAKYLGEEEDDEIQTGHSALVGMAGAPKHSRGSHGSGGDDHTGAPRPYAHPGVPGAVTPYGVIGPPRRPMGQVAVPYGPQPGPPSMSHLQGMPVGTAGPRGAGGPGHGMDDPNSAITLANGHKRFQSLAADLEYNTLSSMMARPPRSDAGSASSPSFSDHSESGRRAPDISAFTDYNQYALDTVNIDDLVLGNDDSPLNDWRVDQPRPPPISLMINERGQSQMRDRPSAPAGQLTTKTPAEIYRSVQRPFPYTPGFHTLIRYLKSRFRKPELMQIVQSMAKYRPSFIAYSNALTEDDLVFLEQCFQRSLLEYEKYFAYWGTPTVIWRRTGQIAAVGAEFGMLTGWTVEELLAGRFIMELMDDKSVVEYFRLFSSLSFGDTRGSAMSDCVLLTPQGKAIRTSSVLTLKRDIFGIPMLIIGNFLPVLTKN